MDFYGEFYLDEDIRYGNNSYTQVLEEIVETDKKLSIGKKRVIDLGKVQTHPVSTDCFGDDDTIAFLAEGKSRAKEYGLFLRNKILGKYRLDEVQVYHQFLIRKNKSRGGWLYMLVDGGRSGFGCDSRLLGDDVGFLFGGSDAKVLPQDSYSSAQISKGIK